MMSHQVLVALHLNLKTRCDGGCRKHGREKQYRHDSCGGFSHESLRFCAVAHTQLASSDAGQVHGTDTSWTVGLRDRTRLIPKATHNSTQHIEMKSPKLISGKFRTLIIKRELAVEKIDEKWPFDNIEARP
jgi:hypothetical protein